MAEYVSWATHETALKAYLGISGTDEDTLLQIWLATAVERADLYLERDFVDGDGADTDPPTGCLLGVYEFVKAMREHYPRAAGVQSVTIDKLTEAYSTMVAHEHAASLAFGAAKAHWSPWKERPWLDG